MSQNFSEIAKEITIAAIEHGMITPIKKSQYKDINELKKYNRIRAEEIGNYYKIIAKAVDETVVGKFETTNEQE